MHTRTASRLQILLALGASYVHSACAEPGGGSPLARAPEASLDCFLAPTPGAAPTALAPSLALWGAPSDGPITHTFDASAAARSITATISILELEPRLLIAYHLSAGAPFYLDDDHMVLLARDQVPSDGFPLELDTIHLDTGNERLALGCAVTRHHRA